MLAQDPQKLLWESMPEFRALPVTAALLPISYQLLRHQRGGVPGMEGGRMGNWTRKGRETYFKRKVVLRMERDLGCLKLGCSDSNWDAGSLGSPSVRGLIKAEPRSGSSAASRPGNPEYHDN